MPTRAIIHVDMDAFYAAVEQRDRPEIRGRPVVVGADPAGRGVVSAASYEARRYGIHSAMPVGRAHRLCPDAVFLPVDMPKYARVSAQIMAILVEFTPLVEPLSLDEAFLDVTGSDLLLGPAVEIARCIKARVRGEIGLTASAGVASNKFLAKIASDLMKPDGLVEVRAGEEVTFLHNLPIGRLWGIGPKTEAALTALGVRTIGQLARIPASRLRACLGPSGVRLLALARGEDERPVVPWHDPKSIGAEETFGRDTRHLGRLRVTLLAQAERIAAELRGERLRGRTVTLKVRFADFTTVTRRDSTAAPTADEGEIFRRAWGALERVDRSRPVRLVGLSVSGLSRDTEPQQLLLFGQADKAERIGQLRDELSARFGARVLRRASLLGTDPSP